MLRKWLKASVWISGLFTIGLWIYRVLDAIGNYQTARSLVSRMPEAIQYVVKILYWPLTGPIVCVGCLVSLYWLDRSFPFLTRRRLALQKLKQEYEVKPPSEKDRRNEVRDKLSAFLIVGDKLKRRCANSADDVSEAEVDKWYSMVATYIRENVSYADKNRFISDTNIPRFPRIERRDGERERIWQVLNRRTYQLAKILDELKPL